MVTAYLRRPFYFATQTADFEVSHPILWSLNDAPKPYIQALCRAIVGIRLDVTDIQAQFKLSQNKSAENKAGVVAGLKQLKTTRADEMAALIEPVNGEVG